MKKIILILGYLLICETLIFAQHLDKNPNPEAHDHLSKHHLALFNGATTNFDHNSTAYTLGVDYEFRISQLLGIGIFGEYIFSEPKEILGGISVYVHPANGLKIIAAPVLIYSEGSHDIGHESESETHFACRLGAGYDFHVWIFSIGPAINYDIGKSNAINYGVSLGYGF